MQCMSGEIMYYYCTTVVLANWCKFLDHTVLHSDMDGNIKPQTYAPNHPEIIFRPYIITMIQVVKGRTLFCNAMNSTVSNQTSVDIRQHGSQQIQTSCQVL